MYSQISKAASALAEFPDNPSAFFKKLLNRVRRTRSSLIVDKATKRFIKQNQKVWEGWSNKRSDSVILVDFYGVSQTLISYSYFLNILARRHDAAIKSFATWAGNRALYQVYRSFNTTEHIVTVLNEEQERRKKAVSREVMPRLKTKQDVLNLEVLGVWIGIDIYETYLRYGRPTVYLDDPGLIGIVEDGIGLVIFWQDFFEKHKVAAVVLSHDCYNEMDIPAKVAYQKTIPVYFPTIRSISLQDAPHSGMVFFKNYRQLFQNLSVEEQLDGISLAKKQLQRRFNGEVGVDMPYSTKSAFEQSGNGIPVLRKSDKIKVLIATHCFYDNPHGLGGMLFVDFYEWLCYLGQISEKTGYDWYLKMHPDPLPGTEDIVRGILANFPRITFIPPGTSHYQLAREGIDFVLTAYGSVGHEYPAFGVQVINAGYNPHIAYDFNWHPKSIEEYEYYLLNLDKLHKEINIQELYEFYYMHHYYIYSSDLFLKSYWQFLKDLDSSQQIGPAAYEYFLNQLTEGKHQEIIANIQKFIDSGKRHYFSHGPV